MALTLSQWENEDRRGAARARLQLRLAVVYPQREGRPYRPIYHATTYDLGMSGLSMVVEDNAFHEGEVTVLLALPPAHSWAAQKVITVTGAMTYAIHSSKLNAYKIGVRFLDFKADGRELLQTALEQRSQAGEEPAAASADAPAGSCEDSQASLWC